MERLGLGGREMTTSGHSKDLVLKVVQPSLVGLMDGSVSTLAPLFATAFATGEPRITFLVGLAAAVGAAISMGFSEGLSDDGSLTGRGHPFLRGAITGIATFIGGILHTLPFLLPQVGVDLYLAFGVVGFELLAISFIRYRYFRMSYTPVRWPQIVLVRAIERQGWSSSYAGARRAVCRCLRCSKVAIP